VVAPPAADPVFEPPAVVCALTVVAVMTVPLVKVATATVVLPLMGMAAPALVPTMTKVAVPVVVLFAIVVTAMLVPVTAPVDVGSAELVEGAAVEPPDRPN